MSRQTNVLLSKENEEYIIGYLTEKKEWEELNRFTDRESALEFAHTLKEFDAIEPTEVLVPRPPVDRPTHGLWADVHIECEMVPMELIGSYLKD